MKKLLFIALLLASTSAYAADTAPAPAAGGAAHVMPKDFGEAKAERLKHINDKLVMLQKAQTCVQAASDFAAMKACNTYKKGHGWHHHGRKSGAEPTAPANSQ